MRYLSSLCGSPRKTIGGGFPESWTIRDVVQHLLRPGAAHAQVKAAKVVQSEVGADWDHLEACLTAGLSLLFGQIARELSDVQ